MTDQAGDSDLRRRAAWLLGLLAVVAALIVVLFITLTHTSGSGQHNGIGSDDSLVASPSGSQPTSTHRSTPRSSPKPSSSSASVARVSCTKLCVVDGDLGNSIGAINDYRVQHGRSRVPGTVSKAAQQCALSNGGSCSGGWAESQVSKPTGAAALEKIIPLGKVLDPSMKSFEVGWAYDPQGHQYFFSIIKHS